MADPNSIEPFKNEIEIRYLKASFERLDQRLGVHTETPQRLTRSFQRKLDALAFPPKKVGASWKAFWAAIVASFSLGMVLNFVVLRPATMTANITTSPATLTASNTSPPSVVEPFQPTKITSLAVKDQKPPGSCGYQYGKRARSDCERPKTQCKRAVSPKKTPPCGESIWWIGRPDPQSSPSQIGKSA